MENKVVKARETKRVMTEIIHYEFVCPQCGGINKIHDMMSISLQNFCVYCSAELDVKCE